MTDFKVPFGRDSRGNLIPPHAGSKKTEYTCSNPKCGQVLTLNIGHMIRKDGEVRATHFKHKRGTWDSDICNGETWEHETAKEEIRKVVQAWIDGTGSAPNIHSDRNNEQLNRVIEFFRIGNIPSKVLVEKPFKTITPDVSIVCSKEDIRVLALAIEVHMTNAVPEQKAEKYANWGMAWIEVDAMAIIENPSVWLDIAKQRPLPLDESVSDMVVDSLAILEEPAVVVDVPKDQLAYQETQESVVVPTSSPTEYLPKSTQLHHFLKRLPDWLKAGAIVGGAVALAWLIGDEDERAKKL